jgi:hypothetical protein
MDKRSDIFDELACEVDDADDVAATHAKPGRKRPELDWLKFPIPDALGLATKEGSALAWKVYCALTELELQAWVKGKPLTLSPATMKRWNISRRRRDEALGELEQLGMISVDRQPGRSHRIRLLTCAKLA